MASSSTSTSDSEATNTSSTGCLGDEGCVQGQMCVDGMCIFDPDVCGGPPSQISIVAANLVLVLDKSGSMVSNSWDGDADPNTPDVTRWYSLHETVVALIDGYDGSLNLGLVLFPSKSAKSEYNENACIVEASPLVSCAPHNGTAVLDVLPPETATSQIQGATPARSALLVAHTHLADLSDPRAILLVTDGGANCAPEAADNNERFEVYDQLLLDAVESAYGEGIPVFVVGIDIVNQTTEMKQDGNPDNVNVYQKLNAVAVAGGRPKNDPNEKFYQTTNQLDLKAAVSMIADQLMTCEVALGSAPTFPDLVELSIDGQTYPSNDALDCVGEDGWIYTSPDHTQLELCGEACARFKSAGVVDVTLGCPE